MISGQFAVGSGQVAVGSGQWTVGSSCSILPTAYCVLRPVISE